MESMTGASIQRRKEEAVSRLMLFQVPDDVVAAFMNGQLCRLDMNGNQYKIIEDEETKKQIAEFERQRQATVFLVATAFVEWLGGDWDVLAFVGPDEQKWAHEKEKIVNGYTWVHALSDFEEDQKHLEGHIDVDALLPLKVWQKRAAVSWLKKMQVPQFVTDDFASSGQVYVTSTDQGEFRKPNAVLKKQIAAFEKNRDALVYLVVYQRAFERNCLAYVTGDRGGDGGFMEQQEALLSDSLDVYALRRGDGYFDDYCESSLSFVRKPNGDFSRFIEDRW